MGEYINETEVLQRALDTYGSRTAEVVQWGGERQWLNTSSGKRWIKH